jgi:D-inositol-3-phosphate glycosyltransferase
MEAAVNRTPSVAFRVGGLEESVLHGRTGLLVSEPEDFAGALRRVLVDPALREALGAEAIAQAIRYSWEDTALGVEAVLDEALDGRWVVAVGDPLPAIEP